MPNQQAPAHDLSLVHKRTEGLSFREALTAPFCLIDVRSPREYEDGSLPAAINIPVFDDEERSLVGTIYRRGGKDPAIEKGFQLVQARLEPFLARFRPYGNKRLAVFCARGGMRSRSVVNLLQQHGLTAWQLTGGYKGYRQLLLEDLARFRPALIVLHGYTGTGKTRLLQQLSPTIDLEDLAQHQSSLFGGLNRSPRTQKWFDSHLHQAILNCGDEPLFIEGESRKLGNIYLPATLYDAMQEGVQVLVEASMETRVARIVADYPIEDEETLRAALAILNTLQRKIGYDLVSTMTTLLRAGKVAEMVYILLREYYDKRYDNSLGRHAFQLRVSSDSMVEAVASLMALRGNLREQATAAKT